MRIDSLKDVAAREDAGALIHVRDETGAKMYFGPKNDQPVTMLVAGSYSSTYRRASDASRDRMLKKRSAHIDGDEINQRGLETVAACVLEWSGFEADGAPPQLTKANVVALLDAAPWIREQVEAAMADHASFFTTA